MRPALRPPSGTLIVGTTGGAELPAQQRLAGDACQYVGNGGPGVFRQSGGTNSVTEWLWLGTNPGASGSYSLSGSGQLNVAALEVGVAGSAVFTHSGGTNNVSNYLFLGYYSGASGSYSLSGSGQLNASFDEYIGLWGTGTFRQAGAPTTLPARCAWPSRPGSVGLYDLSGGTLTASSIFGGGGTSTFQFNGGLLQAGTAAAGPFVTGLTSALVESGGARVDTNGRNVIIAQSLADGGGGGGLTKYGSGTLTLSGTDTYRGATTVLGGMLDIASADALPAGTTLAVAAGAAVVLEPDLGHAVQLSLLSVSPGSGSSPMMFYFAVVCDGSQDGAVPEPATFALLAAGAVAAFVGWRREK